MFHPPKKEISEREAEAAASALGLELPGVTKDVVRSAFRRIAVSAHPDTTHLTNGELARVTAHAAETIAKAQEARDVLNAWIESLPDDECAYCHGRGWVRNGMVGAKPCSYC
jgi:hypothetical protein